MYFSILLYPSPYVNVFLGTEKGTDAGGRGDSESVLTPAFGQSAVASTGSLNLPVRPRLSPFPVFWGARGMSPALRYDRCVMVVIVLENHCGCLFLKAWYGKIQKDRRMVRGIFSAAFSCRISAIFLRALERVSLFPRATSQADMPACPFGNCREGQKPRSSVALHG